MKKLYRTLSVLALSALAFSSFSLSAQAADSTASPSATATATASPSATKTPEPPKYDPPISRFLTAPSVLHSNRCGVPGTVSLYDFDRDGGGRISYYGNTSNIQPIWVWGVRDLGNNKVAVTATFNPIFHTIYNLIDVETGKIITTSKTFTLDVSPTPCPVATPTPTPTSSVAPVVPVPKATTQPPTVSGTQVSAVDTTVKANIPTLANTGSNDWWVAIVGVGLIGLGIFLKRRFA